MGASSSKTTSVQSVRKLNSKGEEEPKKRSRGRPPGSRKSKPLDGLTPHFNPSTICLHLEAMNRLSTGTLSAMAAHVQSLCADPARNLIPPGSRAERILNNHGTGHLATRRPLLALLAAVAADLGVKTLFSRMKKSDLISLTAKVVPALGDYSKTLQLVRRNSDGNPETMEVAKGKAASKDILVSQLVNSMLWLGVTSWLIEVRKAPEIILLLYKSLGLESPDLYRQTTKKGHPLASTMKDAENKVIREMQMSGVEALLCTFPKELLCTVLTDAGYEGVSGKSHKELLVQAALLGRSVDTNTSGNPSAPHLASAAAASGSRVAVEEDDSDSSSDSSSGSASSSASPSRHKSSSRGPLFAGESPGGMGSSRAIMPPPSMPPSSPVPSNAALAHPGSPTALHSSGTIGSSSSSSSAMGDMVSTSSSSSSLVSWMGAAAQSLASTATGSGGVNPALLVKAPGSVTAGGASSLQGHLSSGAPSSGFMAGGGSVGRMGALPAGPLGTDTAVPPLSSFAPSSSGSNAATLVGGGASGMAAGAALASTEATEGAGAGASVPTSADPTQAGFYPLPRGMITAPSGAIVPSQATYSAQGADGQWYAHALKPALGEYGYNPGLVQLPVEIVGGELEGEGGAGGAKRGRPRKNPEALAPGQVPFNEEIQEDRVRLPISQFARAEDLAKAYRLNELRGFNKSKGIPGFGSKIALAEHAITWCKQEMKKGGEAARLARLATPGPTRVKSGRRRRVVDEHGNPIATGSQPSKSHTKWNAAAVAAAEHTAALAARGIGDIDEDTRATAAATARLAAAKAAQAEAAAAASAAASAANGGGRKGSSHSAGRSGAATRKGGNGAGGNSKSNSGNSNNNNNNNTGKVSSSTIVPGMVQVDGVVVPPGTIVPGAAGAGELPDIDVNGAGYGADGVATRKGKKGRSGPGSPGRPRKVRKTAAGTTASGLSPDSPVSPSSRRGGDQSDGDAAGGASPNGTEAARAAEMQVVMQAIARAAPAPPTEADESWREELGIDLRGSALVLCGTFPGRTHNDLAVLIAQNGGTILPASVLLEQGKAAAHEGEDTSAGKSPSKGSTGSSGSAAVGKDDDKAASGAGAEEEEEEEEDEEEEPVPGAQTSAPGSPLRRSASFRALGISHAPLDPDSLRLAVSRAIVQAAYRGSHGERLVHPRPSGGVSAASKRARATGGSLAEVPKVCASEMTPAIPTHLVVGQETGVDADTMNELRQAAAALELRVVGEEFIQLFV